MGIKNLMKLINKYSSVNMNYIFDYKNKILAFDANLLIYKSIFAIRANGYDIKNKDIIVTHIHTLLMKIIGLKKYNIKSIFVFDGIQPEFKSKTIEKRKIKQKEMSQKYIETNDKKYYLWKSDITIKEFQECIELIKLCGLSIVLSDGEADLACASLIKNNLVDAIVSDDNDMLLFGSDVMLKNFTVDDRKIIQEINLNKILSDMNLTQDQLIDLGILLGCDYCEFKTKGIGPMTYYKNILEFKSIPNLVKNRIIDPIPNYNLIKQYFKYGPDKTKIKIINSKFDKKKLINLLLEYQFKESYIKKIMENL